MHDCEHSPTRTNLTNTFDDIIRHIYVQHVYHEQNGILVEPGFKQDVMMTRLEMGICQRTKPGVILRTMEHFSDILASRNHSFINIEPTPVNAIGPLAPLATFVGRSRGQGRSVKGCISATQDHLGHILARQYEAYGRITEKRIIPGRNSTNEQVLDSRPNLLCKPKITLAPSTVFSRWAFEY